MKNNVEAFTNDTENIDLNLNKKIKIKEKSKKLTKEK